jgi:ABC-type branched-subunit amino acid transport system substrate-binding protein
MNRRVFAVAAFLFAFAAHAQEGVTKDKVVLGQSIALTGADAQLATAYQRGAKLYFDRVNAAGGINGRKIELVTLDDQGDPKAAAANTAKLLEQGVFALFGYYGSPQVTASYAAIKDGDMLLFAPMAGADEFHGALYANVYCVRPGYAEEAAAIVRHSLTLGTKRLGILHARDTESLAALDSATRTMTSFGANLVATSPIAADAVAAGVDKVIAAKPESLLVIGAPSLAANAMRTARAKGFRGPIYGFSNSGESLLAEELGPAGAGVVVVRVVPKSDSAKVQVVRDLAHDAQTANAGKPNVYMLEGYIAARVFTEALKHVKGDPNRARLRKAIDSLGEIDIGGFRVQFESDRTASKVVQLSLIDSQGKVRE